MRQDQLAIDIVWASASVTLRLSGEIDMCTAELVREAALAAIDRGHTDVHIDMSAVTFMDSTGLNMLLATSRRAEAAGGRLQLVDPTRAVRRVLEVTGVQQLFEIAEVPAPAPGATAP
jgi:anti-sigma B factor antagonist